jgi:hypothetical protein
MPFVLSAAAPAPSPALPATSFVLSAAGPIPSPALSAIS